MSNIEIYGAVISRTKGDTIDLDGPVDSGIVNRLLTEDITWQGIGLDEADCNFCGTINGADFSADTIDELLVLLRCID